MSKIKIPAYIRYNSNRIKQLQNKAQKDGVTLLILSGKFGIIPSEKPIEFYDKLLLKDEINNHSELISNQLSNIPISKMIFYHKPVKYDPNLQNYIDCISKACKNKKISLTLKEDDW